MNEQLYAPKKYYFNDLGLRNSFVGFSDIGSLVENAVFLRLSKLYGVENIYYYADGKLNEIDFVVDLKKNNLLLVESKYNNLTESVINSLSTKFYKDIYEKEIIDRLVVTDGINDQYKQGSVPIKLINLQDFLENDLF